MAREFQGPKGTRDFYPRDMALRRHIEAAWRQSSVVHGFEEIDGPTFEHLELYTVKSGEGIVSELFSFRRAGGEDDYALRPEFTPTLARMVAAKAGGLPHPIKWFAIPSHFRAERPQRGRLREFLQWNVDLLGIDGPQAEVEVLSTAIVALERLGLSPADVRVKISHRGVVGAALRSLGVPEERTADAFALLDRRDKLDAASFTARAAEIGLGGTDGEKALEAFARVARARFPAADAAQAVCAATNCSAADAAPLAAVLDGLKASGMDEWCEVDLGIVRGLAYYTGAVFELHEASGGERAIAGGGRYDGLVEMFGGPRTPAVGMGMGDVVLALVLRDRGKLPADDGESLLPRPDAFFISAEGEASDRLLPGMLSSLRRDGLHVRQSYKSTRNVGKLLADAGKCRARMAVILGAEVAEGMVQVKDLDRNEQVMVAVADLARHLRGD
ncbi:MAG: histidine--tRNA ligase [Planctomycetes bacterium]|nr:histidine--tRNA ligase [Planctomycetota bacterium]